MTEPQKELLEESGTGTVCLDSTHGTTGYQFELTTLLVLDEVGSGQAKEFGTFPGFVAFSVAVAVLQHPVAGTWLAAPVRLDSESKVSNKRSHDNFDELIDAPGSVYIVAVKCEVRTLWLF
ncbi:hypothetical protein MRX96_028067 [Rhipicephalus microplus]